MKINLHTHTNFSDGSSYPEEYVREAIAQGFDTLGFSDHAPVPFPSTFAIRDDKLDEYVNTILDLKKRYSSPQILLALEVDYIPGITKPFEEYRRSGQFDYLIGSVHLVKLDNSDILWFICGRDISVYDNGLREIFHGDIRKAITSYFHQTNEMILTQKPDIIGHLDQIRMYNRDRYFNEDDLWYVNLVDETLEVIRYSGCLVEVNTRGMYKNRSDSLFPGPAILKKINQLNIPIILSSDAHKPDELSLGFDQARDLLQAIGFKMNHEWNFGCIEKV